MNKNALVEVFTAALLVSIIVGVQILEVAQANWIPISPKVPPPLPPTISITAPQTRVYHEKDVTFSFHVQVSLRDDVEFRTWSEETQSMYNRTLQTPQDKAGIPFITYTLDKVETILRNITAPYIGSAHMDYIGSEVFDYSLTLKDLSEGNHTLIVNASGRQSAANLVTMGVSPDKDPIFVGEGTHYSEDTWSSSEITFIIDVAEPIISINLPKNITYSTDFIQLAFKVNEPVTWTSYSIDGATAVICEENMVIPDLSDGSHKIVVYANDTAGNVVKSDAIFFTVNTQPISTPTITQSISPSESQTEQPTLSPTPTSYDNQTEDYTHSIIIISLAITIGICLGVYFKKRRG